MLSSLPRSWTLPQGGSFRLDDDLPECGLVDTEVHPVRIRLAVRVGHDKFDDIFADIEWECWRDACGHLDTFDAPRIAGDGDVIGGSGAVERDRGASAVVTVFDLLVCAGIRSWCRDGAYEHLYNAAIGARCRAGTRIEVNALRVCSASWSRKIVGSVGADETY